MLKREMRSLQNRRTNYSDKFIDPDRINFIEPNKKPRIERPSWHGLRHLYFQETKSRLLKEGKMTLKQIEDELSERMGHHRNNIKRSYSDDIADS